MFGSKCTATKLAVAGALGAAALVSATVTIAQDKPAPPKQETEGAIFERQQIMQQLDDRAETLGNIVAGIDEKSSIVDVTKEIASLAKEARASFQQQVPGGRAKPEVWSNHSDYMARMDKWVAAADGMAKLAETGTKGSVITVMGEALPCKQCHDVYRAPAKPKPAA